MYIEPSIPQKALDVENNYAEQDGLPLFSIVEFNIWGACNRRCSFCPVSNAEVWTNRHEGISLKNYEKVLRNLSEIDYSGVILWSTFSEPLLHKQSLKLIQMTKLVLPKSHLHIVSNGDVLRRRLDFIKEIYSAGADKLQISLYDGEKQFEEFVNLGKALNLTTSQWELRRRFFDGQDYGLTISNRAGLIESNKWRAKTDAPVKEDLLPIKAPCTYIFYQLVVDWDGSVLMCAHDWRRELIIGNAFDNSILDIWQSSRLNKLRARFIEADRNFSPCKTCDVQGSLIGQKHFENFRRHLQE